MTKRSDYDPSKGVKPCAPHRLELTKESRRHLWTDRDGDNWTCPGYEMQTGEPA